MVSAPNNFQSIFGGIFRGLSNNRSSGGLNQTNTQNSDNPLTYQWIGFPTPSDLRQQIQKEQTQNPSLPFEKGSGGTSVDYSRAVLTDIPTLVNQGSPGTDISLRHSAASAGSPTNIPTGFASPTNWVGNGYGMSPQNGDHFKTFFANQLNLRNVLPKATPMITSLAISEQADTHVANSNDSWKNAFQLYSSMQKQYYPMSSLTDG